ncbi:hypothetical protein CAPTEDRAFT_189529 [Capitella teleta]|uniref:Uncharacterized protein n=1 Tax=Capitella teleta TaxID=283909 RepID=R7THX8_CAPTE|nr:hypothetical protein CAPTEDRAFT_189529 [Capitella teleta]|eukprot:ELT93304.1 hypothetical protein CAPTEDRAFT_189529 [Capitella teleta]
MASIRPFLCLSAKGLHRSCQVTLQSPVVPLRLILPSSTTFQKVQARHLQSSGWGSVKTEAPNRGEHTIEQTIDKNLKEIREGDFKSISNPEKASHFKQAGTADDQPIMGAAAMPHPIWTEEEVAQRYGIGQCGCMVPMR